MSAVLKPCAHCGGEAKAKQGKTLMVSCTECTASTFQTPDGPDSAIAAWNRRPAPQVALTDALPKLPPLPEFDAAADLEYTKVAPDDWDEDYRSIWTKLQVELRNKMQWRAHALELRKLLTYAQQCIEARNQQGDAVDAARYRWLRLQDWFDNSLCVLRNPKDVLQSNRGLGADCPSRDRLDAAIDAAIEQRKADKKGGSDADQA